MEKGLYELLIDELHDLQNSEEQIAEALPLIAAAAESSELKKAFEFCLKETKGQIQRLNEIFKLLGIEKKEKFCMGMKGLLQECKEVLKKYKTKSPLRDAALISKAQKIAHFEIAAYGTARTFAMEMDLDSVADLLQAILNEEEDADKNLTRIAEGGLLKPGINHFAKISGKGSPKNLSKGFGAPKKTKYN